MKTRTISLPSGRRLRVPANIQRIDCAGTAGWQVRYQGTKFFSDAGGSPVASLRSAKDELDRRIQKYPAPDRLKRTNQANKQNDMPIGISGPVLRVRKGAKQANLLVLIPRFGMKPRRATIYIGTENTYTQQRLDRALKRAIEIRTAAESAYRRDATAARRASS